MKIQELLKNTSIQVENGINTQIPPYASIGTRGQGILHDVDYKILKRLFGKPHDGGDGKTRKEWCISIDGVVCTVYDWKQGPPYGEIPLKDATWSVGGSHPICQRLVQGVIDSYRINGWEGENLD